MSEHAEWAVRLDDGAVLLRCACGWQEHVWDNADVAAVARGHEALIPEQAGQAAQRRPVGGPSVPG